MSDRCSFQRRVRRAWMTRAAEHHIDRLLWYPRPCLRKTVQHVGIEAQSDLLLRPGPEDGLAEKVWPPVRFGMSRRDVDILILHGVNQRRPQPYLLPPRLVSRSPSTTPATIAAQQMRQRLRIHRSFFSFAEAIAFTRCGCTSTSRVTSGSTTSRNAGQKPHASTATCTSFPRNCRKYFRNASFSLLTGPPAQFCLLLPSPSCNKISGEDLRQRGSSRASFRACASSTYSTLGGTPFSFSLHLSEAKDPSHS